MVNLGRFNKLVEGFSDKVDFLSIYIVEAHPSEDGFLQDTIDNISIHTSIEDRAKAAEILKPQIKGRLVLDCMSDEANKSFGAQPDRLFIVGGDGLIAYISGRGPTGYDLSGVESWIQDYVGKIERE